MKKIHLLITAAIIWGIPGFTLTTKGILAYLAQPKSDIWWLLLITATVLASFFFMFRKIVNRYSTRITSLPEHTSILQTFPPSRLDSITIYDVIRHIASIYPQHSDLIYSLLLHGIGPNASAIRSKISYIRKKIEMPTLRISIFYYYPIKIILCEQKIMSR